MNTATVNSIDVSQHSIPNNEEVNLTEDALYASIDENDFAKTVNDRISRANAYWDKLQLKSRRETNYKYWLGDQVDTAALRDDLEKGSDNAIFRNLETLIPIVSARTPELTSTPTFKNKETRQYAQDITRVLPTEWEIEQGMQPKVGRGVRNHQMQFIAVYQLGYDPDADEFWTEEIVASDLVIDKDGKFIAKYIKDQTIGDLIEKFPEKKADIARHFKLSPSLEIPKSMLDSPAEYLEVWTDETVGWKLGELVLGVIKNPHFDYEGQEVDMGNGQMVNVKYNHFKYPKMPFIFLTYFGRGVHIMDDTTLIEQAIGPQDWVNKRKRQIGANADSTNGHWVSSGDYISKEEFDKITGGVDEKIWLENGMPADGLMKITGQPLPDYIYNDLVDSRMVLDNLMGTHATTRGEPSGNNTATQDIMQKDQDYGRVNGYIRDGVERLAQEWYEYMYHLYLVYRTEETSIAIPEDDDFETDNVIFSRERVPLIQKNNGDVVPVPLLFRVKQGSTLPKDEVSEYMRAKEMKDILSPLDYFKKTGESNPRELAKNLLIWQNDPFSFFAEDEDIQALQMKMQQQAMAAAQAQGGGMQDPNALPAEGMPPEQMPAQNGEATPEGTANALRAIIEEQGLDPEQVAAE